MNITIGIGNMKYFSYLRNSCRFTLLIAFAVFFFFIGCGNKKENLNENPSAPRANVTVTTIKRESISDTIYFTATSVYNKKTTLEAPITGYVTKVNTSIGNSVQKGNELFVMETKEYHALNPSNQNLDSSLYKKLLGNITITSPGYGQIMDLSVQEGAYIQEGSSLCTIVNTNDLYFNLFVPVEYNAYAGTGKMCIIILSGEQKIPGRITSLLSKTELNSQTVTYLLKPEQSIIIPEGINVKAYIITKPKDNTQLLPKEAVLANETLDKFWLMELVNDSTAVKVPIRKGLTSGRYVEIIEPQFSEKDKIILSGNYGLPDTALVSIQEQPKDED